jgi:hypothetical protein
MLRFIVWIICIYIFAKIIGVVLQFLRPFFEASHKPQTTVRVKETKQQFDNVQDADFEDITDKK